MGNSCIHLLARKHLIRAATTFLTGNPSQCVFKQSSSVLSRSESISTIGSFDLCGLCESARVSVVRCWSQNLTCFCSCCRLPPAHTHTHVCCFNQMRRMSHQSFCLLPTNASSQTSLAFPIWIQGFPAGFLLPWGTRPYSALYFYLGISQCWWIL